MQTDTIIIRKRYFCMKHYIVSNRHVNKEVVLRKLLPRLRQIEVETNQTFQHSALRLSSLMSSSSLLFVTPIKFSSVCTRHYQGSIGQTDQSCMKSLH